jgi:hypothetical protein
VVWEALPLVRKSNRWKMAGHQLGAGRQEEHRWELARRQAEMAVVGEP